MIKNRKIYKNKNNWLNSHYNKKKKVSVNTKIKFQKIKL